MHIIIFIKDKKFLLFFKNNLVYSISIDFLLQKLYLHGLTSAIETTSKNEGKHKKKN